VRLSWPGHAGQAGRRPCLRRWGWRGYCRAMRFGILGPLSVADGERQIVVPGAKPRALLVLLVLHAGRVVPADRLVDGLWGEHLPADPANALQALVSRLRRALDPSGEQELLASRPSGYLLAVDPEQVDAVRFERLAAEGHAALAAGRPHGGHPGQGQGAPDQRLLPPGGRRPQGRRGREGAGLRVPLRGRAGRRRDGRGLGRRRPWPADVHAGRPGRGQGGARPGPDRPRGRRRPLGPGGGADGQGRDLPVSRQPGRLPARRRGGPGPVPRPRRAVRDVLRPGHARVHRRDRWRLRAGGRPGRGGDRPGRRARAARVRGLTARPARHAAVVAGAASTRAGRARPGPGRGGAARLADGGRLGPRPLRPGGAVPR
jgi:DNA-binding winged helix-turn-helix (wHTH) protein